MFNIVVIWLIVIKAETKHSDVATHAYVLQADCLALNCIYLLPYDPRVMRVKCSQPGFPSIWKWNGAEENGSARRCALQKPGDQNSNPKNTCEKLGTLKPASNPTVLWPHRKKRWENPRSSQVGHPGLHCTYTRDSVWNRGKQGPVLWVVLLTPYMYYGTCRSTWTWTSTRMHSWQTKKEIMVILRLRWWKEWLVLTDYLLLHL